MIYLNKKSRKLILLQRNELLSKRQKFLRKKFGRLIFTNFFVDFFQLKNLEKLSEELFRKELNTFEKYLPSNLESIMDIGCGLGILNIFINQKYTNSPNFFLLDKNKIDPKIKYGFNDNYESYNDLYETKNILIKNGISDRQIILKNVDEEITINKTIDLVLSLKSMGFHYPLQNYTILLKKVCTKDTTFIFDVASERYKTEDIKKYFEEVNIIYEEYSQHPLKRLYCKGLKI